jgi:putative tryptophan/tyrosine transport system substrate-binding protein
MNRRCLLLLMLGSGALAVQPVRAAEQSPVRRRLGVVLYDRPESWDWLAPALRKALAELGWVEGTNLSVEWHFANGDSARLAELASQVARSGVDAILTRGTPTTRALQRATTTIPIVTGVGDPIGSGFAASYANPGSNITGLSWATTESHRKQIELLKSTVPGLARLIIVLKADRSQFAGEMTRSLDAAAREFGLVTRTVPVDSAADLQTTLRRERNAGFSAAFVFGLGASVAPKEIADIALRNRLPTMFEYGFYVEAGGLMSYRLNWEDQTKSTAIQLDKLFRGIKPAQIPFELPTRSEFVINRATAKALGLAIPQTLLLRADQVIE